ncbi:TetR/AcrR family transcriptional regulator [Pukyongiella litopenaei]|uniref:TetR/AcrR family transcriptional regulator n=1 Tax=Pukyongiella litopenaei TaxID=2605946 RepID=A0A2S0MMQ0_9RHOB|nr:TetR/AcrR family transcriptional regulator [Pukyongiella litopenaei]AVO37162.1 TetR/AcrR family transcriptional regulator [Pukyongiella litopenaei]
MTKRLTRDDWIAHGLVVLRDKGHEALKAEPMASALGVSRGSFYWHFPSLGDFHGAILRAWRSATTERVIADLKGLPPGRDQLATLIQRAIGNPQVIEKAVRRWGGVDPLAAACVREVDQLRFDYLDELFRNAGATGDEAAARATLLTWAFIGRTFAPDLVAGLQGAAIDDLTMLLLGREQEDQS